MLLFIDHEREEEGGRRRKRGQPSTEEGEGAREGGGRVWGAEGEWAGEDAAVESITSASVGSVEAPASDDGTALNPDSTVPATVVANEAAAGVMQQQGEGGPAPPEQEAAAGVMQRAMRNRRARNLMQERAQERARELSEEAAAEEMAANEAFADLDNAAEGGCMSRAESGGGYKRKLKRKELNTMSLNELKQLHRNNGIKMNGNKTVNALINNYIKNYK